MRRITILLVLPALFLTAACGGGGDDDGEAAKAPSTTDGPPEILSEEELVCPLDAFSVNAITGLEVDGPTNLIETGDGISCTFGTADGDTGISLTTYTTTGSVAMDTMRGLLSDAEEISIDWADEAIWSPGQTTLQVLVGEGGAQVMITDFSGAIADPLQTATELGEFAAG